MTCDKELDIVLLIDGSGSLGKTGWAAEIKAAQMFVDAFSVQGTMVNMATILYSGPRTWGGVFKCFARNTKKVDRERICGVKMVNHFTSDLAKVKKQIANTDGRPLSYKGTGIASRMFGGPHVLFGSLSPSMPRARGSIGGPLAAGKKTPCLCRPSMNWRSLT